MLPGVTPALGFTGCVGGKMQEVGELGRGREWLGDYISLDLDEN